MCGLRITKGFNWGTYISEYLLWDDLYQLQKKKKNVCKLKHIRSCVLTFAKTDGFAECLCSCRHRLPPMVTAYWRKEKISVYIMNDKSKNRTVTVQASRLLYFLAMVFIRCTVFYYWATTEFQCKLLLLLLYYIQRWTENKRCQYLYFVWQHFILINHNPSVYLVPRVFVYNHCAAEKIY